MSESNTNSFSGTRTEQWVSRVVEYSSQYNTDTWSANQVIGPPKVYPRHGDIHGAWAQRDRTDNQFIVVEFEQTVYPEQIDIYETFNPGAVVKVLVRNGKDNSEWETVWETQAPQRLGGSRIFSVPCSNVSGREINQLRLNVNCTAANTWCEIDCIKLIGHPTDIGLSFKETVANLKSLLTDDCLSDVTFELDDGKTISSYRNILSIRCIYFNELFNDYPIDIKQPIRIKNISYEAFYQILNFIFTDKIEPILTYDICLELMRKADKYFLCLIYDQAFDVLKKVINKNNVLTIYMQSGLFSKSLNEEENIILNDAVNLSIDFIQKNRRDVYLQDNMEQLTKEMLLQLMKLVL